VVNANDTMGGPLGHGASSEQQTEQILAGDQIQEKEDLVEKMKTYGMVSRRHKISPV
jgi:hypothetical protein